MSSFLWSSKQAFLAEGAYGERPLLNGMRKEGSWEGAWWLRDHRDEGRGLDRRCCPETQDTAAPKQTSLLSQSLSP